LGVRESGGGGKYLGFPFVIRKNKNAIFNFIRDKVWNKINFWSGKMLSMTGREILLKYVV